MSDRVQPIISYPMTSPAILEAKRCERLAKALVQQVGQAIKVTIEEVAGE
jgi:hypothetical protein